MSLRSHIQATSGRVLSVDPAHRDDSNARYVMPPVDLKFEGGGNGCRTVVQNIAFIASVLHRPEDAILRFVCIELGTTFTYFPKEDRFIVKGHFDGERVQQLIDAFIVQYCLCRDCRNPETTLFIDDCGSTNKKKHRVVFKCAGCGAASVIENEDRLANTLMMALRTAAEEADAKARAAAKAQAAKDASIAAAIARVQQRQGDGAAPAMKSGAPLVTEAVASTPLPPPREEVAPTAVPPQPSEEANVDDAFAALDRKKEKKAKKEKAPKE